MEYDYVIVGGGIAGIYSALKITQAFPKAKVALTEMYENLGGRIETYRNSTVQFEGGAGRIHSSHILVNSLVKRYNLTKIKIPSESSANWIGIEAEAELPSQPTINSWSSIATFLTLFLSKLDPLLLQTKTVEELLTETMEGFMVNSILRRFAYTSEMSSLRADLALESFKKEFSGNVGYFYTLKEGIHSIIENMLKEIDGKIDIYTGHRLVSLENKTTSTRLHFSLGKTKSKKSLLTKKTILAIPSESLKGISIFKNLPILKRITMRPLLRVYGVFPTPPWFENIPRTITDSPIRNVIPISTNTGTIMTSYTDSKDTEIWMTIYEKYGEKGLSKRIIEESEKLFNIKIPEPHLFKIYYWKDGCSYWLPGLYDVEEASRRIMYPLPSSHPNIYVCGESYCVKQAWIESALEHTETMLRSYIFTK